AHCPVGARMRVTQAGALTRQGNGRSSVTCRRQRQGSTLRRVIREHIDMPASTLHTVNAFRTVPATEAAHIERNEVYGQQFVKRARAKGRVTPKKSARPKPGSPFRMRSSSVLHRGRDRTHARVRDRLRGAETGGDSKRLKNPRCSSARRVARTRPRL